MNPACQWVLKLLDERRLTATELARMAGVAPSTLCRGTHVKNPTKLSNRTLRKLASVLNVQVPHAVLSLKEDGSDDLTQVSGKINLPEGRVYATVPAELSNESRRRVEMFFASLIETKA